MRAFEKKTSEAVAKSKANDKRPRAGLSRSPLDGVYAAMANVPNPAPQPWMTNPAALPKKPPVKRHFD